ncbi:MAG: Hsp20/alpha crystallin family protein [Myxococcales bacterium]|nr:Hsp20/alpha crystallin family protein [Myxococcales bacterium]MCB9546435.1 Hsp20/alpha crystallin family protein [Myxococcales bacterium]
MLFRFDEIDRAFGWMNAVHHQLDRMLAQGGLADLPRADHQGRVTVEETEGDFWLRADLPGVRAEDVDLQLDGDVLTLSARRAVEQPEGHRVHMQERRPFEFTRALKLPGAVDADAVKATFDAGVLTIRLGKRPVVQPRAITVNVAR